MVYKTLSTINRLFRLRFGLNPLEINSGNCYHWAYIAYRILGGTIYYCEDRGGHAWLKLNNLYYDAEAINGVSDHCKLPTFKEPNEFPRFIYRADLIGQYKKKWHSIGAYGWSHSLCRRILKEYREINNHG